MTANPDDSQPYHWPLGQPVLSLMTDAVGQARAITSSSPRLHSERKLGAIHYRIVALCFAAWSFDFYDLILYSFLLVPIARDLHLSNAQSSLALGLSLAMTALGGVLFGFVGDRFGRKPVIIATAIIYGVGTTLCGWSRSLGKLLAYRAFSALGIGGEWAAGQSMICLEPTGEAQLADARGLARARRLPAYLRMERGQSSLVAGSLMIRMQYGGIFGYGIFGWLADRFGRRPIFCAFGLLMAVGLLPLTVGFGRAAAIPGFVPGAFVAAGIGTGTWAGAGPIISELLPTRVRNSALGLLLNVTRGIQFFTPLAITSLSARLGLASTLAIGAIFSTCGAAPVWTLPETRGCDITLLDRGEAPVGTVRVSDGAHG